MTQPQTPGDVLLKAVEAIGALGWGRAVFQDGTGGPVCALGAIGIVVSDYAGGFEETELGARATHLLADEVGCETYEIPDWNDDPARTKEEVIDAMTKAAHPAP